MHLVDEFAAIDLFPEKNPAAGALHELAKMAC